MKTQTHDVLGKVPLCVCFQDALSSILVARDGYGDMAVSNAIGSNVFDINLGLGLPFIIRIAIDKGKPIDLLDDNERVSTLPGHKSANALSHESNDLVVLWVKNKSMNFLTEHQDVIRFERYQTFTRNSC